MSDRGPTEIRGYREAPRHAPPLKAAERLSRERADVEDLTYPIVVAGDPDPEGTWGELSIVGPGRWHLRSHDGSVTVLPGAYIL